MDSFLNILRQTHILVGCIGLIVFWVALLSEKGGRVHKRGGRLFALCALYSGGTGLCFSIWAIIHPASFFGDPEMQTIDPEDVPMAIENARFLYSITGFLAVAVLSSVVLGVSLARTHRKPARLVGPAVITALGVYGLWSLGLVIYGIWSMIAIGAGEHVMSTAGSSRYWASIILGIIGLYDAVSDMKHTRQLARSPSDWLPKHMECMLGAGIGFHAAALFFGINEWSGLELRGTLRFAPLFIPFVIGIPAMWWWIARWERRMNSTEHQASE